MKAPSFSSKISNYSNYYRLNYYRLRNYYLNVSRKLSRKETRALLATAFTFFTVSFFVFFAIRPTLTTIASLQRQIKDARKLDKDLTDKIMVLTQARERYDIIQGGILTLEEILPVGEHIIDLIRELRAIENRIQATVSGKNFSNISLVPIKKKRGFTLRSLRLALSFSGDYKRVKELLRLLETSKKMIEVKSLSLEPTIIKDTGERGIKVNIQANYYFLK